MGRPAAQGLYAREAEIMDLWDSGKSIAMIAEELDLEVAQVKRVVGRFYDDGEQVRENMMIAAGSAMLSAAIHRARAERCEA